MGRVRRSATTSVIAAGIVATLAVDIVHASAGSAPGTATLERAYLAQLRPVAINVHNAMAPAEAVISAITTPHAGDAYAARDALIHGDALAHLESARAALRKLDPPAPLAKSQQKLETAAAKMATALRGVPHLVVGLKGIHLANAINRVSGGNLAMGAGEWQVALDSAYVSEDLDEPPGLSYDQHAPASRTAWIFRADRACSAASYMLEDVVRAAQEHTLAGDEAVEGHLAHMLSWTHRHLTSLPEPTGASALPARLELRLHTLGYNATIFSKLRSGLAHTNISLINRLLNQLDQVRSTLRALSSDLNRYGATSCGLVIGQWAGNAVTSSSSPHDRTVDA